MDVQGLDGYATYSPLHRDHAEQQEAAGLDTGKTFLTLQAMGS